MAEMWGIPMFTHSGGQKHAAVWASDSCRKEYISAVHLQALTYPLGMNTEWIYTHCYIYTLIIGDRQQCYRYLKEKTFCQWSLWVPQESTLTFDSLVIHFSNFFVLCHQEVKDESVFMSVTFAPFLIFRLRRHLHQLLEQTEYRASNNQFYVVKKNSTNDLQVYICPIYQNRRQSCHKGSEWATRLSSQTLVVLGPSSCNCIALFTVSLFIATILAKATNHLTTIGEYMFFLHVHWLLTSCQPVSRSVLQDGNLFSTDMCRDA